MTINAKQFTFHNFRGPLKYSLFTSNDKSNNNKIIYQKFYSTHTFIWKAHHHLKHTNEIGLNVYNNSLYNIEYAAINNL